MQGKRIFYVHGFASSAQSGTVTMLRKLMPNAEVMAFDLPLHPEEAMTLLRNRCSELHPNLIVGTSMGGMYTEMLYGYDRIVVNPAFEMGDTMIKHGMTGKQTFLNPRADGVQDFIVTKALVAEYKAITQQCFAHADAEEQARVYGLFGDKDPIVDTFDIFQQHYTHGIYFRGAHQLSDKVALHALIPVIRWIDDRQDNRQRPILYIDYNTLFDSYQKPLSDMQKTFELLLAAYQVYIVAPMTYNQPDSCKEITRQIQHYLGVPTYQHLIFTHRRDLLYGDYLLSRTPEPEFLGTVLRFGQDDFKTWEDTQTFFRRLGNLS